ncbi:transposase [Propioniciclava sinopodophylli]|uniref:transposase n=1 Tax=Propioniciclava sinopodophylli TaxID=1837344 RepID=UPI0019D5D197|nr:transposase [Propioniciclava sinopodophylli]
MRFAAACSRRSTVTAAAPATRSTGSATSCAARPSGSPTNNRPASRRRSPRHDAVHVAWQCAQRVRAAYAHPDPAAGRQLAEQVVDGFPSCPIPEIARLGRTLRQWKDAFLAYFDTDRASNGGTEAINGLIELHRRIARGFRNRENYRLRMLLVGGGLTLDPPQV